MVILFVCLELAIRNEGKDEAPSLEFLTDEERKYVVRVRARVRYVVRVRIRVTWLGLGLGLRLG